MKRCAQCGTELPDEARFCLNCAGRQEAATGGPPPGQAQLAGSGAIARDGSVAAGAGGAAIGGDVHGNVYVGPPAQDPAEALTIYRRVLVSACRHLPLRGVDVGASDPTSGQQRLDLAQVYADLDTKSRVPLTGKEQRERHVPVGKREERETRSIGILEAAIGNRRLVILGDPGSGKSTFLSHLALCLARQGLEPGGGWLARLPGWPEGEADALPIPVVLRDFARYLPEGADRAAPCHLWDFIVQRLEAQNLAFAAEPLHQALEQEGRVVVLLDGLDEVPTRAQRAFVRDAVAAFSRRYPHGRLVITCRTFSYQDPAWQLEGVPAFELAPLDEEKIARFIGAWYAELARLGVVRMEDADGLTRRLRGAVRRPDLWRLAPNPLLLTVMALVHTHKGRLPDARALLYEDTVDILLWRWEQIKAGGEGGIPRLRQLLLDAGRTDVDLKRALWRLAFEAHREGGAGDGEALADIGELRLQKVLAGLHPEGSRDWAHQVIEAMKLRAGLLLERAPEVYTFPHRTFQEYLAGAHLSVQANFAQQAARLVEEGTFWREVVLLAVVRLVYLGGDTDKPLALVGELCPQQAVDEDAAWRKVWLAGEILVEVGLNRVRESVLGRDLVERMQHRISDLLRLGRLSPVERVTAGRALAKLGDPRPGVGTISPSPAWGERGPGGEGLPARRERGPGGEGLPDILWCHVPPGPFTMGSADDDEMAWDDEKPQRRNESITEGYWISRYPITNAQFRAFVEAGGYQERRYWTEAGWEWKWSGERTGPDDYDEPFTLPNHPVVGVSWYEAVAFCRWLTERLQVSSLKFQVWRGEQLGTLDRSAERSRQNLEPETLTVQLPSEAEWEKAARGVDGRQYPWGDEVDANRANYGDAGIGTTSAVGCSPGGASPYGVEDLSGNVWEWCATKWKSGYARYEGDERLEGDDARVLRGGAFGYEARNARCAIRNWHSPYSRYSNLGFRVAAARR